MIEAKKASDAAASAQKSADSVNVLHKLASTSNTAAKQPSSGPIAPTADTASTTTGAKKDAPETTGSRRRFEDPVNATVESSSKFAKEVEKVLDAAIFKTGDHSIHPGGTSANGAKSARTDANPNFDASRFDQPINRKAEKLNPFAKEIDKVIDSAIAKGTGGIKRTGDETGLMNSISRDSVVEAAGGAKPLVRKESRTGGSSGGPDLKKLLARRKADASSPNILDRAQQAAKGESEAEAAAARVTQPESLPAEQMSPAEIEDQYESPYKAEIATAPNEVSPDMVAAAENTLAAFSTAGSNVAEEPVKGYSMPFRLAEHLYQLQNQ
jgi:hypothetical protein